MPDKRPTTAAAKQPRQLSEDEEQRILMVCNLPQYADLPASQIVPLLADKGVFWYLYLILDIYIRKIVGWEVHDTESGERAT